MRTVPLKVKDLIEELLQQDPEAQVCLHDMASARTVAAFRVQQEPSSDRVEISNRIGRWD